MIQIELWQLLTAIAAIMVTGVGGFWAVAKVAGRQLDEKLEARFDSVESSLGNIGKDRREDGEKLHRIELELAKMQADMPHRFVTRIEFEKSPSHNDLGQMYKAISELSSTVNQLVGENRGQTDTLRLILNKIADKGMQ